MTHHTALASTWGGMDCGAKCKLVGESCRLVGEESCRLEEEESCGLPAGLVGAPGSKALRLFFFITGAAGIGLLPSAPAATGKSGASSSSNGAGLDCIGEDDG